MGGKHRWGLLGIFAALLAGMPQQATAQVLEPPKLAVSVGAGMADPLHADLEFKAPEWQIAVRTNVTPHFALEGFFDQWRHSTDSTRSGLRVYGPDGVIGTIPTLTQRSVKMTRVAGFNGLARGSVGRLTVTGGGGPGYLIYDSTFTQIATGCEPTQATLCHAYQNRWTEGSFTLQALIGAEIAVTSRFDVFGQLQATAPVSSPDGTHVSTTGGVRIRVW